MEPKKKKGNPYNFAESRLRYIYLVLGLLLGLADMFFQKRFSGYFNVDINKVKRYINITI